MRLRIFFERLLLFEGCLALSTTPYFPISVTRYLCTQVLPSFNEFSKSLLFNAWLARALIVWNRIIHLGLTFGLKCDWGSNHAFMVLKYSELFLLLPRKRVRIIAPTLYYSVLLPQGTSVKITGSESMYHMMVRYK